MNGLLAHSSSQSKGEDIEQCRNAPLGSALQVLLNNKERLQQVAVSINLLNGHFDVGKEMNSHEKGISQSPYWEVLKFFCQSLAESIYVNRKEIFSEAESASSWEDLSSIHDAFRQFCHIFLQCLRYPTCALPHEDASPYYSVQYILNTVSCLSNKPFLYFSVF